MNLADSVHSVTFDTAASRYHSGVYIRKRVELNAKLNAALSPYFLSQLKNLHKLVLKEFRKSIQDGLKGEAYDFALVIKETREKAEGEFVTGAKEVLLEDTEWSYKESLGQLKDDMEAIADLLRVEETKKMVAAIEVRWALLGARARLMGFACRGKSRSRLTRRSSSA